MRQKLEEGIKVVVLSKLTKFSVLPEFQILMKALFIKGLELTGDTLMTFKNVRRDNLSQ